MKNISFFFQNFFRQSSIHNFQETTEKCLPACVDSGYDLGKFRERIHY